MNRRGKLDINIKPLLGDVVPIPLAVWLFGSGLLSLIKFARGKS